MKLGLGVLVFAPLLLPTAAFAQRGVPQLDSAMAALAVVAVFDSMRSHGSGPGMTWIAGDSATFAVLAPLAARRQILLNPPGENIVFCPGTRWFHPALPPLPEGYHVFLNTRTDSGRVYLDVQADCHFIRSRPINRLERFKEGRTWEIARGERGWRIVREYMRWAT
jgi:hypothetical protein